MKAKIIRFVGRRVLLALSVIAFGAFVITALFHVDERIVVALIGVFLIAVFLSVFAGITEVRDESQRGQADDDTDAR